MRTMARPAGFVQATSLIVTGHRHRKLAKIIAGLQPSLERLLAMKPETCSALPKDMPKSGIYLISEGGEYLYVGRSKNIGHRLRGHSRPGSTHGTAAFAFLLARRATGQLKTSYRPGEGSRTALMADDVFRKAFEQAKARICQMEVRFVAEPDSVRQAILEIYVAMSLNTPYNDFDTH